MVAQDSFPDRQTLWIRSLNGNPSKQTSKNEDWSRVLRKQLDTPQDRWSNAQSTIIYQQLCRAYLTHDTSIPESRLVEPTVLFPLKLEVQSRTAQHQSTVGWPAGSYALTTSQHFAIATQGTTKQANEVARLSEQTYSIWRQIFFSHWCKSETLQQSLTSQKALVALNQPKFQIVLFRNREAYVNQLQKIEPNVAVSTGYYSPRLKTVFCYWDEATSKATLRHELTHQFFSQASGEETVLPEELQSDFWIVEGLALYMESIQIVNVHGFDIATIGGWDAARLQPARYRRLHDEMWIPWDEFRRANNERFRTGNEIAQWYSQAAGLTHFWMDRSSEHRQAFLDFAMRVYRGLPSSEPLVEAQQDEKLRRDYDHFLLLSPRKLLENPPSPDSKELVLSRCPISSNDLLGWPESKRKLDWLDLSFSKIDDRLFLEPSDLQPGKLWDVRRLNVESTHVSNASLPIIAMMPRLEELDLSQCGITDAGLEALRGHKSIKTLWLTGNAAITNQGLAILASLPKLELTDLSETSVSEEGWKSLLAKSPKLRRKKSSQ